MKIKCLCGNELQLFVIDDDEGDIYNCPNLDCDGQVIIKGNIEVESDCEKLEEKIKRMKEDLLLYRCYRTADFIEEDREEFLKSAKEEFGIKDDLSNWYSNWH